MRVKQSQTGITIKRATTLGHYAEASADEIAQFVKNEVSRFVETHPNNVFSAFAFDCNIHEEVELNLCLTTSEHLNEILHYYQTGANGAYYQSDEGILSLKYNTGDWKYQCFSSMNCIHDEHHDYFSVNGEEKYHYWINLLSGIMTDFMASSTFAAIPKCEDFKVLVYDHEEEPLHSQKRLNAIGDSAFFRLD